MIKLNNFWLFRRSNSSFLKCKIMANKDPKCKLTSIIKELEFNSKKFDLSDEQKNAILEEHRPLEFIQRLEKLSTSFERNSPLVDGITLSEVTGIKPGRKLGMLKGWLFRQQIEKNITCKEDVLKNLELIDWKNDNYEKWPVLSWP